MRRRAQRYWPFLLTLLFVCLASSTPAQTPGSDATIRIGVNVVRIPARVVDGKGKVVRDLKSQDFQVFENGSEQRVALFDAGVEPVHVALVVDTSVSTAAYLSELVRAAKRFASRFGPEDRIALYEAGPEVVRLQPFTPDRGLIRRVLDAVETAAGENSRSACGHAARTVLKQNTGRGGTLLYDALLEVKRDFPEQAGRRAMIVFTDGLDQGSDAEFKTVHNAVLRGNEQVFALLVHDERFDIPKLSRDSRKAARAPQTTPRNWALIFDSSQADEEVLARFETVSRAFLNQVGERDRVWLFRFEGRLLPVFAPPMRLTADQSWLPYSAADALKLLPLLRVANSGEAPAGAPDWSVSPDVMLFFTDDTPIALRNFVARMQPSRQTLAYLLPKLFTDDLETQAAMQTLVHDPGGITKFIRYQASLQQTRIQAQFPALTADSGGQTFYLHGTQDVEQIYAEVVEQIRSSYTLGYYTSAGQGRHHLQVKLRSRDAQVHARRAVLVN